MEYRIKGAGTDTFDTADVKGYVHVLRRDDFSLVSLSVPDGYTGPLSGKPRPRELCAYSTVEPIAIAEVGFEDFPYPIQPM
ncbi:hypothetical protein IU474_10610 [Nocardia otitidiscaviarum]|uniref:hypothetical protein n=1 Tax=Nocardia otitidiscaviarum TaxID=1823 RepID=UPI0018952198|nr:hypothetical protein [Nocardia otitidiscaviarum]MBF6237521.1 hypothetical protein [Nocardia otitidiscaviarum]